MFSESLTITLRALWIMFRSIVCYGIIAVALVAVVILILRFCKVEIDLQNLLK